MKTRLTYQEAVAEAERLNMRLPAARLYAHAGGTSDHAPSTSERASEPPRGARIAIEALQNAYRDPRVIHVRWQCGSGRSRRMLAPCERPRKMTNREAAELFALLGALGGFQ